MIERCLKEVPRLTSTSALKVISPSKKIRVKIICGSRNIWSFRNLKNWKITRIYNPHQSGDSKDAIPTAIPGLPTNGKGPQRNTKAGQRIDSGLVIFPGSRMWPFNEEVSEPTRFSWWISPIAIFSSQILWIFLSNLKILKNLLKSVLELHP